MAYVKHNFEKGQMLKAEHLNNIEDGLVAIESSLNPIPYEYMPEGYPKIVPAGGDTLIWDGNTEGLVSAWRFYKVSDAIVTLSDIESDLTITADGVDGYSITVAKEDLEEIVPGLLTAASVVFVEEKAVGVDADGLVFPESGTYIKTEDGATISITIPGYTGFITTEIKTIDEKYLPEYLQSIDATLTSDTLTWDGNTNGLLAVTLWEEEGYSEVAYKISNAIVTISDLRDGVTFEYNAEWSEHIAGDLLEEYVPGIVFINDAIFVAENGAGVDVDGVVYPESGIYIIQSNGRGYVSSVTIPGYTNLSIVTVKNINTKYLPKHLQFGEITTNGNTLTWDGNPEGLVSILVYEDGLFYEKYCKVSENDITISDLRNGVKIQNSEGYIYDYYEWDLMEEAPGIVFVDEVVFVSENGVGVEAREIVFPESGVYFMKRPDRHITSITISGYTDFITTTIKKIDKKYLPNSSGLVITYDGEKMEYTTNMTFEEARASIISGMAPTYVRYLEDNQVKTHGFNYAETGVNYNTIQLCFNDGTSLQYL